jgi:predicted O-methyltransferase YrrM
MFTRDGNVRLSELGVLAQFAAACEPNTNLFEIGTFDGRTALNLALNAPESCQVITLDLPSDTAPRFEVFNSERQYIDKPVSGERLLRYMESHPNLRSRVHRDSGDSATFDFTPYAGTCSLVFVDGSHAYEYVKSDTEQARRLVKSGGVIIWHDYGVWSDVTRSLEELDSDLFRLTHIAGTSLVIWRSPARSSRVQASPD